MDKYSLPVSTIINGKTVPFNADFRDILKILNILSEPNLLEIERIEIALEMFYNNDEYKEDIDLAISEMNLFISGGVEEKPSNGNEKPLYDWDKDYQLIAAPVNKVLGYDCRGKDFLHWWTFLSAFMEMGECTLNTYMGIREKLNKGKKLEKWEEKIYKENVDKIRLTPKYDDETQRIIDEIMGV